MSSKSFVSREQNAKNIEALGKIAQKIMEFRDFCIDADEKLIAKQHTTLASFKALKLDKNMYWDIQNHWLDSRDHIVDVATRVGTALQKNRLTGIRKLIGQLQGMLTQGFWEMKPKLEAWENNHPSIAHASPSFAIYKEIMEQKLEITKTVTELLYLVSPGVRSARA